MNIASTVAYRTQIQPPAPSSSQQAGRTHHHRAEKATETAAADTSQTATSTVNGALLDTLI